MAIIRDGKAKLEDRLLYTRILGELRPQKLYPGCWSLPFPTRTPACARQRWRRLVHGMTTRFPRGFCRRFENFSAELRPAAFALLQSRPRWTQLLLKDLQAGKLPLGIVSNEVADTLRNHADKQVSGVALKLFPKAVLQATSKRSSSKSRKR